MLQKEIATAVGISTVTYSRYENAERRVPDEVIIALADFFGTTPWFIRYGVDGPVTRVSAEPEPVAKPAAKKKPTSKRKRAT